MSATTAIRRFIGSDLPLPATTLGLTPALWLALFVLGLAIASDVATTGLALALNTQGWEGNPLAALLLRGGLLTLAAYRLFTLFVAVILARLVVLYAIPSYLRAFALSCCVVAAIFFVLSISNLMAGFLGQDLFHFVLRLL